ncbi:hypothetical protein [Chamaesiphon sp. VAR_69_metabat_338]|uniref:hypothetical protein n=1 Tax=Chamaesiphon sp. VAR_69_metabat_338 TaxID=2964704 RepID=UPI00286D7CCB|nr:hypothetical protein [Chamaesiphon sp. VAR_69_metabat_338]
MAKNTSDPVGTLSIGNVITTSTTLYKSNFKRYLLVSLRAIAWIFALGAASFGLVALGGRLYDVTKSEVVKIPVGLGTLAVVLYFMAKYATDRATICRLAYQELIDAPETLADATRHLLPRTWAFLRLNLLLILCLFLVSLIAGVVLLAFIFLVVAALLYVFKLSPTDTAVAFVIGLLTIGLFVVWIAIIFRYYAYWFVAELPLAVESTTSANFSIRRSRQLTGRAVGNVLLIMTIAFLIVAPLNTVSSIPSFLGSMMTNPILSSDASTQFIGGILTIVGTVLTLAIELLLMPFWQIIKAIVYFDLRNRREGNDLVI